MPTIPKLSSWVKEGAFVFVHERTEHHSYSDKGGPMRIRLVKERERMVRLEDAAGKVGDYIFEASITHLLAATTWREARKVFLEVVAMPLLDELKHEVSIRLTATRAEIARLVKFPTDEDELAEVIQTLVGEDKDKVVAALKGLKTPDAKGIWEVVDSIETELRAADSVVAGGACPINA